MLARGLKAHFLQKCRRRLYLYLMDENQRDTSGAYEPGGQFSIAPDSGYFFSSTPVDQFFSLKKLAQYLLTYFMWGEFFLPF